MSGFQLPGDLRFNRALIEDPRAFFGESGCASWLFIVGDEFAAMPGGMSYAQVREAAPRTAQVASDPPRVLDLPLARQHVDALDSLPRPTLVSCRTGPRASAVAYMYAGLKAGAAYDDVIAAAERDSAPFCKFPEYRAWLRSCLEALG
jgi:hypothetical protein